MIPGHLIAYIEPEYLVPFLSGTYIKIADVLHFLYNFNVKYYLGVLLLISPESFFYVTDIDECASPTICGAPGAANCTNTESSYTCTCNAGFVGGGMATRCTNESKF